jgi:hypothetical protein
LAGLAPGAFAAGSVLATAATAGDQVSTDTAPVPVILTGTGGTSVNFTTTVGKEKVVIVYNAKCSSLGPDQSYVSVIVTVDGKPTNPNAAGSFPMCTSSSTTNRVWVAATRQAFITLATAGVHAVQVTAQLQSGATEIWLGDGSLVVFH